MTKLNRKEIVQRLKELGLTEKVKTVFGDNYTRVSNENLQFILDEYDKRNNPKEPERKIEDVKPDSIGDLGLRKAFVKLLTTLQMSETLYPEEISEILKEL